MQDNDQKPIEDILNEFYKQADQVVGLLTTLGDHEDELVKKSITDFAKAILSSYEAVKTKGYKAAWEDLDTASVGFIRLCRFKDEKHPNVNVNMSAECAAAYRALPDPQDATQSIDADKLDHSTITRFERAYNSMSPQSVPVIRRQPDVSPLKEERFVALQNGEPIWIKNKFGGDDNWYAAEVTRPAHPESLAPAIHFKVTDERKRIIGGLRGFGENPQFLYYFSDAHNVSRREN